MMSHIVGRDSFVSTVSRWPNGFTNCRSYKRDSKKPMTRFVDWLRLRLVREFDDVCIDA